MARPPTAKSSSLTVLPLLVAVPVFLSVAGALFPHLPILGVIGTLLESFFSLHLVLEQGMRLVAVGLVVGRVASTI
jgi:hypothetical protein